MADYTAFGTGPALLVEPFTYANGNLSDSAAWTGGIFGDGSLVVASNVLTCTSGSGQSNATEEVFGDGDYGITVPAVGTSGSSEFYFCLQDDSNYYSVIFVPTTHLLEMYAVEATAYTLIGGSGVTSIEAGDKFGIRKAGSSISLMVDSGSGWVELDVASDATYSSGKVGLWSNDTGRTYDNLFVRELMQVAFAPTITATVAGPVVVGVVLPGAMTASITASVTVGSLLTLDPGSAGLATFDGAEVTSTAFDAPIGRNLYDVQLVPAGAGGTRGTPGLAGVGSGRS